MSFLRAGSLLHQYRILRVLGSGGFGVTYLARDESLDKLFAIKEYFPTDFAWRESATVRAKQRREDDFAWGKERFVEEARVLARFAHRNIVGVVQIFEAHNTAYIVEEYQNGRSLKAWLAEIDGPPTQKELDLLVEPLLDALDVIHRNGVLHRDIAPDNIYIRDDDGSPVLLDFGSAREAMAQRTKTISAVVKSGYSPQEQYSTRGKLQGPWSDIYALAATLYHVVTGSAPEEATERVLTDEYVSAKKAVKGLYRENFLEAIDWGLQLTPAQRPQSIAEWRPGLLGKPDQEKTPAPQQEPRPEARDAASAEAREPAVEAEIAAAIADWKASKPPNQGGFGLFALLALVIAAVVVFLVMQSQDRRQIVTIAPSNEDSTKSRQDADSVRAQSAGEEATYQSARGNAARLKNYVDNCSYCSHRSDALSEIARLENAELKNILASSLCRDALDSSKSDWDTNYQKLVAEAQRRGLDIDGCRSALGLPSREDERLRTVSAQSLCQDALDSSKSGWDSNYQTQVAEARRRGLDIDGCRRALGMQSRAEEEETRNPTVKFDITNNTSDAIGVAFYDGSNRSRFFPDEGRYYQLGAGSNQTYSMSCSVGQNICFGAWKGSGGLNPFWGVGPSGMEGCTRCCTTCPTRGVASYTINNRDARRPNPTLTWKLTDATSRHLAVAFYSSTRQGHTWPGANQHWNMNGGENTYTISCMAGEAICYGAWDNANPYGAQWGAGLGGRAGCNNCCGTCNGGVYQSRLVDSTPQTYQ